VTIEVDCAQTDWQHRRGNRWASFEAGYRHGYDVGCQSLFGRAPDGRLYDNDVQYTIDSCKRLLPVGARAAPDVPLAVPGDARSVGVGLGMLDGCRALFDRDGVTLLTYGVHAIAAADCPVGVRHGDSCLSRGVDGAPVTRSASRVRSAARPRPRCS
jgi:hypothetical protein